MAADYEHNTGSSMYSVTPTTTSNSEQDIEALHLEALQRQLEKQQIRDEIIRAENMRRQMLGAEVRRELMMEQQMSMQRHGYTTEDRSFGGHTSEDMDDGFPFVDHVDSQPPKEHTKKFSFVNYTDYRPSQTEEHWKVSNLAACNEFPSSYPSQPNSAVSESPNVSLPYPKSCEIILGGPAPALIKAEVPWSARRGSVSEEERVLKTVKGILNKLTPEKFDLLKCELINSGVTTPRILMGVVQLIYEKAVLEPTFCPMYALLCSGLIWELPQFPPEEPGGREITFKRLLLNTCQEAFERGQEEIRQMNGSNQELERRDKDRMVKLRIIGNIRFIGELLKHWMNTEKIVHFIIQELLRPEEEDKSCPAEVNVEAICQLFNTIGKRLDSDPKLRRINDIYFSRLKELVDNPPQLEARLRFMVQDVLDLRANNWAPKSKPEDQRRKTLSFLREYLGAYLDLSKAIQCVVELNAPDYHPELVKEAIYLAVNESQDCVERVWKLLEFLLSKEVITPEDMSIGFLLFGSMLDDAGIDVPRAPAFFGRLLGRLILIGAMDFKLLKVILKRVYEVRFQKAVFDATMHIIGSNLEAFLTS